MQYVEQNMNGVSFAIAMAILAVVGIRGWWLARRNNMKEL